MNEPTNKQERKLMLFEGMYNGVSYQIDDVHQALKKEFEAAAAKQVEACEALLEEFRQSMESLLAEFRYLSQQNTVIYEYSKRDRISIREDVLDGVREDTDEIVTKLSSALDKHMAELKSNTPVVTAGAGAGTITLDYEALARALAPYINDVTGQTPSQVTIDYDKLADRVAESANGIDYNLVAEYVADVLPDATKVKLNEESIERIAVRVAELLRADDADIERIAKTTVFVTEEQPAEEEIAPAAAEVVVEEVAEPVEEVVVEEVPVAEPVKEKKPKAVVVKPVETAPEMTTRYKRSFIAKIIESEDDVKEYYSELKNALLGYQRSSSQIGWTNDRFVLHGETVAKIGIRGKTLCLFLALNPEEFPESVYHQKYAGDTKMYEKTPMMVKIKSGVALKRGIRLVELLMEKNGAVAEEVERVDYAARYAYRSEEELLAEGLIKTAVVEKSDLKF